MPRLAILMVVVIVGLLGFAAISVSTLNKVKVNGPLYNQIVQGKDLVADILPPPEYIIEAYLTDFEELNETNSDTLAKLIEHGQKLKKEYAERHEYWSKELPEGNVKTLLLQDSYLPAKEFFEVQDQQYTPALLSNDRETVHACYSSN